MGNFRFYLKLLAFLGVSLLLIAIGQSYIEYRSGRAAVLSLFETQAETMIASLARAGEKGLIAYQSLQEQTVKRLLTVAATMDLLDRQGLLNDSSLKNIVNLNQLATVIVFDKSGNLDMVHPAGFITAIDSAFMSSALVPFMQSGLDNQVSGFRVWMPSGLESFDVLHKNSDGKVILAGIDAGELLSQRRAFGTGSIIEDIANSSGIKYAGIMSGELVLVATKDFPFEEIDSWYGTKLDRNDTIINRIKRPSDSNGDDSDVFEAVGPFIVADQNYGNIVVGLKTSVLVELTSKLKWDIFWQSILSLLVTLAAVTGVVIWNNFRLVSRKYNEIKDEVQKLEADKAVKARLASMGELAGGVAHEIRNPLNAIRVIIQRLQREFEPGSDREEYLELTNIVKRETDRINDSIEQFLKIARPPALQKSRQNLNKCIESVLDLFQARAQQRNITIEKNLGRVAELDLDSRLCGSAILNILENALDAIGENGRISISSFTKGKKIYCEIEDSGPGIDDDLKSRIFDLYYTTKDSGTGMGLPSVLMIIRGHGGSIDVLDSPAGGAIFRLEFPIE